MPADERVPKRKIHVTRKYTRAARKNHYKRLARLRNVKLPLERKNGTPLPFQLNVLYFLRSTIARTNLEHSRRLLPAPPLRPAISFLGKNEVTKLQSRLVSNRPPLNQHSVPPAFSRTTPASVSPSHFAHIPPRTLSSSSRVSTKSFSAFSGHPVI